MEQGQGQRDRDRRLRHQIINALRVSYSICILEVIDQKHGNKATRHYRGVCTGEMYSNISALFGNVPACDSSKVSLEISIPHVL